MNPYTILEVSPQASDEEIKKKFRILAQRYHPDRTGGDEEKFKQINLAYSVLSDPVRRKQFDTTGKYDMNPNLRDEAMNNLARIINIFMEQIDPELGNLVVSMRLDVEREKNYLREQISICINAINKLEKFLNKIKRKKEGENILKGFIAAQIKQKEDNIKNHNRILEVCDKMIEILDDYQYGEGDFEMLVNAMLSTQEVPEQSQNPDSVLP
jgi:curved DNA-binding protein CbpA